METLEALGRRIATTRDLKSIVRTMRSLSAVSIRQYDQAVLSLHDYSRTVELGLQAVLSRDLPTIWEGAGAGGLTVAVVFGSDHGLCGRFNEQISQFVVSELMGRQVSPEDSLFLVLGARAADRLEAAGRPVEDCLALPGAVGGLSDTAHEALLRIDEWIARRGVERVLLFHNRRSEGAAARPHGLQLVPLDPAWLSALAHRPWPSRAIPAFTMDREALFSALVRQHLFVGLFRAGAESIASEHATRLANMQAAERNIEEELEEMNAAYRHKRQESITEEMRDVVSGFEALRGGEGEPVV